MTGASNKPFATSRAAWLCLCPTCRIGGRCSWTAATHWPWIRADPGSIAAAVAVAAGASCRVRAMGERGRPAHLARVELRAAICRGATAAHGTTLPRVQLSPSLFNNLRDARWNSRLVRGLLGMRYREGHVYRVPFGPLRGLRLRYGPSINYHAMLGLWEVANFRVLTALNRDGHSLIAPDAIVCDVGANIGFSRSGSPVTTYPKDGVCLRGSPANTREIA